MAAQALAQVLARQDLQQRRHPLWEPRQRVKVRSKRWLKLPSKQPWLKAQNSPAQKRHKQLLSNWLQKSWLKKLLPTWRDEKRERRQLNKPVKQLPKTLRPKVLQRVQAKVSKLWQVNPDVTHSLAKSA
jgi:hypothetical protein